MSFQDNRNIPPAHPGHGQGPAGASMSDMLTAVKNVTVAIANLQQAFLQSLGTASGQVALQPTLLKTGPGRVVTVNVTNAPGNAQGYIVDANNAAATGPVIYIIPDVVGSYAVNMPFNVGLVVNLQGGMIATVVYS